MAAEARRLALIAVATLGLVGGGIFWLMTAAVAFNGTKLVEIKGTIGNQGPRSLKQVEITCVFYDAYGQVVLRERVPIVSPKIGAVRPGENKPFRLPFDNIPEAWNQNMPQLVIARIDFL